MALASVDPSSSPATSKPASSSENRAVESTTTTQPVVGTSSGTSPSHGQEATDKTLTSPKPAERETSKQEDASVSATLTSSQPDSSKKKGQTSSSSPTTATKSANTRSNKPSKLSNLLRKLVPCIPSPAKVQPIHADDVGTGKLSEKPPPKVSRTQAAALSTPISTSQAKTEQKPVSNGNGQTPLTDNPETTGAAGDVVVTPVTATHLLSPAETAGMTSGAVVPPGATGSSTPPVATRRHSNVPSTADDSDHTSLSESDDAEDVNDVNEIEDEEERLIMSGGAGIPIGPDGVPKPLLPPLAPHHAGRKCLVLDLDETLVHSSFKSIQQADYVVPVEIEYHWHNVYVIKRPGVDNFLKKMGEIYEVVVFTASLSKYADPVLDKLDIHQVVSHRLFRESCYNHRGNYVKDLSQLGRPIADTIILDNSPASYIFHPNNAVPVSSWFNDPHDTELTDLVPFLTDLATTSDVRGVLDGAR